MTEQEILRAVREVLQEHVQIATPIDAETDLFRDLELDSLKRITLVVELENRFRVCFDTDDEQAVRTVGDIVRLIERLMNGGRSRG